MVRSRGSRCGEGGIEEEDEEKGQQVCVCVCGD